MHQFLRTQQQQHHEEHQTSIKIPSPGDPSAYFAPISPAAKTENPITLQSANAINPIMEMLRAGNVKSMSNHKIFSCRLVRYFGTLFWDELPYFGTKNLLLFTFLTGKLRRNQFLTNKKFV